MFIVFNTRTTDHEDPGRKIVLNSKAQTYLTFKEFIFRKLQIFNLHFSQWRFLQKFFYSNFMLQFNEISVYNYKKSNRIKVKLICNYLSLLSKNNSDIIILSKHHIQAFHTSNTI